LVVGLAGWQGKGGKRCHGKGDEEGELDACGSKTNGKLRTETYSPNQQNIEVQKGEERRNRIARGKRRGRLGTARKRGPGEQEEFVHRKENGKNRNYDTTIGLRKRLFDLQSSSTSFLGNTREHVYIWRA